MVRRLKVNQDEFVSALNLGVRDNQSNTKSADVLPTFPFPHIKPRKIKKGTKNIFFSELSFFTALASMLTSCRYRFV
jgi:hypothetical protein